MHPLICEAIKRKRLLMFGYGDVVRVIEPHLFGVNSAGHEMLTAWLRAGHSRTEPEGGWRNYLTSDITNLQMLDEVFPGPRDGYNAQDTRVQRVFCRLESAAATARRPLARSDEHRGEQKD